ncbi:MAG: MGMT family protein [Phycisphaerae bacterium]|nr:MGMT family protein [Phycisphaerae bacterium]
MKTGLKYTIFKTKWGFFGLLADERGLLRTVLPMDNFKQTKKYLLVGMFGGISKDRELYFELQKAIKGYYNSSYVDFKKLHFSISLPKSNTLICKVVKVCKAIPLGRTITYSQLAKKAGFPKAARAVGSVLAKNPLPLIVPCHRVIRADGKIGKFSAPGGSKTKKKMLELEKERSKEISPLRDALRQK